MSAKSVAEQPNIWRLIIKTKITRKYPKPLKIIVIRLLKFNDTIITAKMSYNAKISQFLKARMVDQMIISIIPVLLGSGIPLFDIKKYTTSLERGCVLAWKQKLLKQKPTHITV